MATDNGGCPITCTVSGNTTCSGGETCDGVTITSDVYTFVGGKLHEVASGSVVLDDGMQCQLTAPASVSCASRSVVVEWLSGGVDDDR